jgi:hypothetical protein
MMNKCPICGEEYDAVIDSGTSKRTPGGMDDFWRVCAGNGEIFVHDIGIGDTITRDDARDERGGE